MSINTPAQAHIAYEFGLDACAEFAADRPAAIEGARRAALGENPLNRLNFRRMGVRPYSPAR
jgi:hypothetical protein